MMVENAIVGVVFLAVVAVLVAHLLGPGNRGD